MCYCVYIMQIQKAMEKPNTQHFLQTSDPQKNTEEIPTLPMKLLLFSSLVLILAVSGSVEGKTQQWCVASQNATDAALQEALDWACSSQGGANCTSIQSEGSCFLPNTLKDHASFAFNDYWQKFKGQGGTCDFKGSALLVDTNPSHNPCNFALLP